VTLTVKYFAWVRERIGTAEERIELPPHVVSVADLVTFLTGRGENYAHAFENPSVVRAAIDQRHASAGAELRGAREVAFFPPMTGG
jgi:molybdopterin synthase sulfur carrier subunit